MKKIIYFILLLGLVLFSHNIYPNLVNTTIDSNVDEVIIPGGTLDFVLAKTFDFGDEGYFISNITNYRKTSSNIVAGMWYYFKLYNKDGTVDSIYNITGNNTNYTLYDTNNSNAIKQINKIELYLWSFNSDSHYEQNTVIFGNIPDYNINIPTDWTGFLIKNKLYNWSMNQWYDTNFSYGQDYNYFYSWGVNDTNSFTGDEIYFEEDINFTDNVNDENTYDFNLNFIMDENINIGEEYYTFITINKLDGNDIIDTDTYWSDENFVVGNPTLRLNFYNEQNFNIVPNVSVYDNVNSELHITDALGQIDFNVSDVINDNNEIDFNYSITNYANRKIQLYLDPLQNKQINMSLLPLVDGQNIRFLVRDSNDNLWIDKYLGFATKPFAIKNPSFELDIAEGFSYQIPSNWSLTYRYPSIYNFHGVTDNPNYVTDGNNSFGINIYGGMSPGNGWEFYQEIDMTDVNHIYFDVFIKKVNGVDIDDDVFTIYAGQYPGTAGDIIATYTIYDDLIIDGWNTIDVNLDSIYNGNKYITLYYSNYNTTSGYFIFYIDNFRFFSVNPLVYTELLKVDSQGKATSFVDTTGDYVAQLIDENGLLKTTYLKTNVEIKKPRDEITGGLIEPWRYSVGGNLQYADTNLTSLIENIMIFGGTTTPYNFTICDWNEIPAYELYVPRTYNVTNHWGSEYDPYYTFQPYLISKADAIAPSIQVIDKLKRPVANIKLEIYGLVNGVTTLIENKYSDATGRVSFSAVPLNLYQVYMYRDNGTILAGTYEIQPRTNNDVFFLMIDLAEPINVQGYAFINIDWDATPESININVENLVVDANVFSYSQNYDVNITSYTMAIYQNGVILDTENFTNSGETAKPYNSYDYNLFSGGGLYPTADIYIIVNYTFLGQTYQKVFKKTIATIETSTGLLWSAKQIPNEIGRFWCVILALLITIGILFSLSSSGFVENTNVIAILGLLILGIFVFIDWLNIGVTVLGVDIMVYTYILCCVFGVYLMMKDGLR